MLVYFSKIKIFKIECNKLAYEEDKMRKQTHVTDTTRRIAGISVFSALAFCVALVTNIPIGFLTFDAKDTIITIASFIYGPVSAVVMSAITALMEAVTVGNTGPWGALMDFISTASFTVTASLIYKYKRNLTGALISLGSAAAVYVSVMMVANLLITPIYMKVPLEVVKGMLLPTLLPFNVAKALMNSALVILIYKPVSKLAKQIGLAEMSAKSESKSVGGYFTRDTVIMASIAAAALAVATVIFIILSIK